MNARRAAAALDEIARSCELVDPEPFRARAYARAARTLETTEVDLAALVEDDALTSLPGVGPGIAETIAELFSTGRSAVGDELRAVVPAGLHAVLRVPGLGTKKARTLREALGVESLDDLEAAARAGRVAAVPGFGAKTEAKILAGVTFLRTTLGRRRYPDALAAAVPLLGWARAQPTVFAAEIVGELRRRMETVAQLELLAAADRPEATLAAFAELGNQGAVDGDVASWRFGDGLVARLRCVEPANFVAATVWETGSAEHLTGLAAIAAARKLRFDAQGLRRGVGPVPVATESALYEVLGLRFVPPELREGEGELDRAAKGSLPTLVEVADLRGTFHCHTTYSDGTASVGEMAAAAREHGWSYLGLADHSQAAGYAGGLSRGAVARQHQEVDAWNRAHGGAGAGRFRVFKGIESDILTDGSLDYDEPTLRNFDYVVGSVHSGFGMPEAEMTERVIRAVRNPRLTMLAHPTGRLLLSRAPYAIDLDVVLDACAEQGVVVEINADPHRLDLDWRWVRSAAERGVLIAVNPDAHSTAGLDNVAFGINVARKGWLEPSKVLNTWTLQQVEAYLERRQSGRR